MKILFIGDIVGRPGRKAVRHLLPKLNSQNRYDLIVANAENAAGGVGITPKVAVELFQLGIHVLTLGNHAWDKKDIIDFMVDEPRLIRPLNQPPGAPGRGYTVLSVAGRRVAVISLAGRVFAPSMYDCPFRAMERALRELDCHLVLVDFHAEATSEKVAMGWYLAGRVSAVVGTHTHVQTADERVLPGGTGYITDAGMTGPRDSVIGIKTERVLEKFITQMPVRFEVAPGPAVLQGVELCFDDGSGKCISITRLNREADV